MAERDREGVFRGSCINHPPHRFGACEKFVLMEGTSKCRTCGCVGTFQRNKMGLEGLRDSYFTSLFAAPYLGLLTNFASCVFVVG